MIITLKMIKQGMVLRIIDSSNLSNLSFAGLL